MIPGLALALHSPVVCAVPSLGGALGTSSVGRFDVILSSGQCAFASHCGFLEAVETSWGKGRVGAVVGTSSGALTGALWAAGQPSDTVAELLREWGQGNLGHDDMKTMAWARRCRRWPWQKRFSLDGLVDTLRRILPSTFDDLPMPLAVGVLDHRGHSMLLRDGPLPEAVAASLASPWLFDPVDVEGAKVHGAGTRDRMGLYAWSRWRPGQRGLLHLVGSSRGRWGDFRNDAHGWHQAQDPDLIVVRSRPTSASFQDMGDFNGDRQRAMRHTLHVLAPEAADALLMMYPDDYEPFATGLLRARSK